MCATQGPHSKGPDSTARMAPSWGPQNMSKRPPLEAPLHTIQGRPGGPWW